MKPLILLDLDRTLFKTDDYWQDFAVALARAAGKPENAYIGGYDDFLVGEGRLQMINYEKIMAVTGAKHEDIRVNLAKTSANKQYLYDDAINLLSQLENLEQQYDIAIITFGENRYQNLKISLVPEIANIPKHIIQIYKNAYIAENFARRQGMLVDDKFGQDLPSGWAEVHLSRQHNYGYPVTIEPSVYEITSLNDVLAFKFDTERGFVL